MPNPLVNSVTRVILRQIESLGYTVGGVGDDVYALQAKDNETGEIFQVEMDGPSGAYQAACELAQMVGIELEDG